MFYFSTQISQELMVTDLKGNKTDEFLTVTKTQAGHLRKTRKFPKRDDLHICFIFR